VSWFDDGVPRGAVAREYLEIDALRAWAAELPDARAAFGAAERGDWLLFLALIAVSDEAGLRRLVAAVCACVREVVALVDDPRPVAALEAAERWSRGELDRAEPRAASAHAQAAAEGRTAEQQIVCHACAACARAVLARERNVGWKAAIADQALRAPAQLIADRAVDPLTDGSVGDYDARRQRVAQTRAEVLRRFATRIRSAISPT
jgi:hypothetical protein